MAHDYSSVTTADRTFTPVSDVTPDGTVEEKFKWNYIVPSYDTWLELLAKEHWADWYFGVTYVDNWSTSTIPSHTYISVSPIHSNDFSNASLWSIWNTLGFLTWNDFYTVGKVKWSHWVETESEYIYKDPTTHSKLYQEVTV